MNRVFAYVRELFKPKSHSSVDEQTFKIIPFLRNDTKPAINRFKVAMSLHNGRRKLWRTATGI